MARQTKRRKWLVCGVAILLLAPLIVWSSMRGRGFGEKVNEGLLTGPNEAGGPQQTALEGVRNADELAAAAEFFMDGERKDAETANEPRPRWGEDHFLPDIVWPSTVAPATPSESTRKEAPKVTSAEAQLTLQMFLSKLTWQEKAMVLKTLTKFSPGEMLEVFQLYTQGSREAYRNLDAILMAKISEADFEKLRVLADKYR